MSDTALLHIMESEDAEHPLRLEIELPETDERLFIELTRERALEAIQAILRIVGVLLVFAIQIAPTFAAASEGAIVQVVKSILRDPDSAKFRGIVQRNGVICGYVNSKNGFGGYTGYKEFMITRTHINFNDGSRKFMNHWNSTCAKP